MKLGYDFMGSLVAAFNDTVIDNGKATRMVTVESILIHALKAVDKFGFNVNSEAINKLQEIVDMLPVMPSAVLSEFDGEATDYELEDGSFAQGVMLALFNSLKLTPAIVSSNVFEILNEMGRNAANSIIAYDYIKAVAETNSTASEILKAYECDTLNSVRVSQMRTSVVAESTASLVKEVKKATVIIETHRDDDAEENPAENELSAINEELDKMEHISLIKEIKGAEFESDPIIGRVKEINDIAAKMLKQKRCNVVLVGDAGVGKTEIVNGFAYRMSHNQIDGDFSSDYRIFCLTVADLVAGSRYRGELEAKLQAVVNILTALSKYTNVIVFIDEIHLIVGTGASGDSDADIANLLKPVLTGGKIKVIGSTTAKEYMNVLKDSALNRRFDVINIDESTKEDTIKILKGIMPSMNKYDISFTEDDLKFIVELADSYIKDKYFPDKAIDVLDSTLAYCKFNSISDVTKDAVISVVSQMTKMDIARLRADKTRVSQLASNIEQSLFGQTEAVTKVAKVIKTYKAGLNDENKTIGNLLFQGKTGVGKTELCKLLADNLGMKMLRLDMSEYADDFSTSKLIGSPAGYVGYGDGGVLTDAVKQTPNTIILFDEIEKAHPKVYNLLLQIMDYGTLTDSRGIKVDFTNALIVFTTNVGVDINKSGGMGFNASSSAVKDDRAINKLSMAFPKEFIGRLDEIIMFNDISDEIAYKVVDKEIGKLAKKLSKQGYKLELDNDVRQAIIEKANVQALGARNICKVVQSDIITIVADYVLDDSANKTIHLIMNNNNIAVA